MRRVITGVIILQAFALVWLVDRNRTLREQARPTYEEYEAHNPLRLALDYGSPPDIFEGLVQRNTNWINHTYDNALPDGTPFKSVLSSCATLELTNHVRILLKHGADPEEAIQWHENYGLQEAADLVRAEVDRMRAEQQLQDPGGIGRPGSDTDSANGNDQLPVP